MKKALIHPIVNIVVSLTLILLICLPIVSYECCVPGYDINDQFVGLFCHTVYLRMIEMRDEFPAYLMVICGANILFHVHSIFLPKIRIHPVIAYLIVLCLSVLFLMAYRWAGLHTPSC